VPLSLPNMLQQGRRSPNQQSLFLPRFTEQNMAPQHQVRLVICCTQTHSNVKCCPGYQHPLMVGKAAPIGTVIAKQHCSRHSVHVPIADLHNKPVAKAGAKPRHLPQQHTVVSTAHSPDTQSLQLAGKPSDAISHCNMHTSWLIVAAPPRPAAAACKTQPLLHAAADQATPAMR
jgi:hypothetical protein